MFSYLRRNLLERNKVSSPILCFVETPFFVRSIFAISSTDENSFTVSYLINSCGLSQEKAVSVSKRHRFETSTKPDSLLTLLRNNGFNQTQISKFVQKAPWFLVANVETTLKPKFDFFNSVGLSPPHLAKALSVDPNILRSSLDKMIVPSFDFLKSIVGSESRVITIIKRSMRVLIKSYQKELVVNIALLRAYGVPDSNIESLLATQPRTLLVSPSRFKEIVEDVKKMGFDSSQYRFVLAIQALISMNKSTLEGKFGVYRRWGWSEDEIQCAFRKEPKCMMISEKNIMRTMDFLVNEMGYNRLLIVQNPVLLMFSMEKRIIPRCSVIQVLISNGLIEKDYNLGTLLNICEKEFVKKFVTRFEEKVPKLMNVYQGKGR